MKRSVWIRSVAILLTMLTCMSGFLLASAQSAPTATERELTAEEEYEAKKAAYREKLMADDVTTDDFLIGSWVSFYSFDVDSYEDQLDQMAAAGINFNIFPRDFGGDVMYDAEYWNEVEAQYARRNMVYLMNGGMNPDLVTIGAEYAAGKEHCVGYHLIDEPSGAVLPQVSDRVKAYRAADPERYPFVNLYPSYAGEEQLGGTYYEHVSRFVELAGAENIEYLAHDFYPFAETATNTNIFADLEVVRAVAYENGKLKTHAFPQSSCWEGMRMPNIDEMRWNVYAYLAYGFKALSWFNMVSPSGWVGDAYQSVIDLDGTIRDPELFAAWSELNWEVRGLSDVLMNLDTVHAYHNKGNVDGVERLPEDFFLKTDRYDYIISVMESKEGDDEYIMVFNKNLKRDIDSKLTVDAASGVKWMEYFDPHIGEYVPMLLEDGKLVDNLLPGEGKLYRLRYDEPPVEETEAETEPATEPVTEPITDAVTAAITDAVTDQVTEPATDAESETKVETLTDAPAVGDTDTETAEEPTSGGCTSVAGMGVVMLSTVAAAVVLRKRKGNGRLREGVTEKTKHAEET